ncbi:hypothetical protein GYB22_09925 [bacterium]|nr:hypothetical protein [bacterium]
MTLAVVLVLLAIGFALIGLELFVTPGFIIGIIGMLFLAAGVWMTYTNYGTNTGHISLAVTVTLLSTGIVVTLRSGFWRRLALHDQITGKANSSDKYSFEPGSEGKTLSALRPSGTALIADKRYEVSTTGEFIEPNTEILVDRVVNNKIFVKPKN